MRIIKTTVKRILLPFFEGYFRLRMVWPVWKYGVNMRPNRLWESEKRELGGVAARIVRDLEENGIAIAHCDEFFPDNKMLEELKAYAEVLQREKTDRVVAKEKVSKPFLMNLFEPTPVINFQNPFHSFALYPNIVDIVNAYFGLYAKLYYLTLNITLPVGSGAAAIASQRWHRDPEDRRMCKVFLYLNDVDETAGPFMYAAKSCYGLKYGSLFPQKPPIGAYPDVSTLEKTIDKEDVKVCTGRVGTIIFCDTSGLHKGGYATAKERVMFTAGYRTNGAVTPNRIRYPENYREKLSAMKFSPAAQYAAAPFTVSALNRKLFSYVMRWREEIGGRATYHEG
ncbi:MAG: hypothetical protein HYT37_02935 [Candidatus Sungbacteria bacterium]|nr:hypothetical protein [Candidatus Sungbacteria bacterium]